MRILYDGMIYELQAAGGINRYFAKVINHLPPDFVPTLLVKQTRPLNFPEHINLTVKTLGRMRLPRVSYRLSLYLSKFEDYYVRRAARSRRFDLAHPTYYTLLTGRDVRDYRCPVVLTVHDMIHEIFSRQMDPTGREADAKRKAIAAADAVICVSQNTKKDLLERHAIPENKVRVIYQASDLNESLAHGDEHAPARPYFIYVGSRSSYKNFDALLRAFAKIAPARDDLSLCVVGSPFREDERKLIAALRLGGRVGHLGYANDSHLAKLYRCSLALVYPSLYEGFGIPPLEAMACG
ncbi:MAG: glycosyltransferase family 4 protein, partial [Pyrinomonadaceae bacterium]